MKTCLPVIAKWSEMQPRNQNAQEIINGYRVHGVGIPLVGRRFEVLPMGHFSRRPRRFILLGARWTKARQSHTEALDQPRGR